MIFIMLLKRVKNFKWYNIKQHIPGTYTNKKKTFQLAFCKYKDAKEDKRDTVTGATKGYLMNSKNSSKKSIRDKKRYKRGNKNFRGS